MAASWSLPSMRLRSGHIASPAKIFLTYCDSYTVSGNSMVFPKDETTPWGNRRRGAPIAERGHGCDRDQPKIWRYDAAAAQADGARAADRRADVGRPDAGRLPDEKRSAIRFRWKSNEAILYGIGNGQPQGALQGAAAIVVAKTSGQATLTLTALNLANMIARLPEGSYGRAIWLINNDVLPNGCSR